VTWDTKHLLAIIALLAAVFGGGVVWLPGTDTRVGSLGVVLAVILLAIALLVT
jgi:hypothetical protein